MHTYIQKPMTREWRKISKYFVSSSSCEAAAAAATFCVYLASLLENNTHVESDPLNAPLHATPYTPCHFLLHWYILLNGLRAAAAAAAVAVLNSAYGIENR